MASERRVVSLHLCGEATKFCCQIGLSTIEKLQSRNQKICMEEFLFLHVPVAPFKIGLDFLHTLRKSHGEVLNRRPFRSISTSVIFSLNCIIHFYVHKSILYFFTFLLSLFSIKKLFRTLGESLGFQLRNAVYGLLFSIVCTVSVYCTCILC